MLKLADNERDVAVLRLMTEEPWRSHGAGLTRRESDAQNELVPTVIPAPRSLALDSEGTQTGESAHLMTLVPGILVTSPNYEHLPKMAEIAAEIHSISPVRRFRQYQSWAPPSKWIIPRWSKHPGCWQEAFQMLDSPAPTYEPVFLHRDFSHRNLLWADDQISGVVDWVETSMGPAWLDIAHGATNLALAAGIDSALQFIESYEALTQTRREAYWFVMDAVGFLPAPGSAPLFGSQSDLQQLDEWIRRIISDF